MTGLRRGFLDWAATRPPVSIAETARAQMMRFRTNSSCVSQSRVYRTARGPQSASGPQANEPKDEREAQKGPANRRRAAGLNCVIELDRLLVEVSRLPLEDNPAIDGLQRVDEIHAVGRRVPIGEPDGH